MSYSGGKAYVYDKTCQCDVQEGRMLGNVGPPANNLSSSEIDIIFIYGNYARASVNTLPPNRPNAHSHWLSYVRVEDAVKMSAKVVALGGRVLVAPRTDR